MRKGKIVIVSGPSGVGKNTILEEVFKDKDLNLVYSISMTTRPKREGEQEGKDYYFVSDEQFNDAIKDNQLIEWATFCNHKYGTPKKMLLDQIDQGKNVILEIEVVGALNVLNMFKPEDVLSIFVVPPSLEELKQRLIARGTESLETIEGRVKRAAEEIQVKDHYQYVVTNDEVANAVGQIKQIIRENTNNAGTCQ